MLIHHVTLCTGDVAVHRLDTLDPLAVDACRALLPNGGQIPSLPAFRVEVIEGKAFTVLRGKEPVVSCSVGVGDDELWRGLCQLQEVVAPVKAKPPRSRWLGVALMPGLMLMARDDIGWLGDFERCMAAALLLPR